MVGEFVVLLVRCGKIGRASPKGGAGGGLTGLSLNEMLAINVTAAETFWRSWKDWFWLELELSHPFPLTGYLS